jgi:type IV secretory pathway ATPase VirB11/archaellum biosynthesis ATPase
MSTMEIEELTKKLQTCDTLKPTDLIIDALSWKYLCRAVLRGKNIILVGPTRSGKTKAAQSVAEIFTETKTEIVSDATLSDLKSDPTIKILKVEEISDEK